MNRHQRRRDASIYRPNPNKEGDISALSPLCQLLLLLGKHAPGGIEGDNLIDLVMELIELAGSAENAIALVETEGFRLEKIANDQQ
jgi:hypothetical protein